MTRLWRGSRAKASVEGGCAVVTAGQGPRQEIALRLTLDGFTVHGTDVNGARAYLRPRHVVNLASMAGIVVEPGEGIYSGTKHTVLGFSISALEDLRAARFRHINISCVSRWNVAARAL